MDHTAHQKRGRTQLQLSALILAAGMALWRRLDTDTPPPQPPTASAPHASTPALTMDPTHFIVPTTSKNSTPLFPDDGTSLLPMAGSFAALAAPEEPLRTKAAPASPTPQPQPPSETPSMSPHLVRPQHQLRVRLSDYSAK